MAESMPQKIFTAKPNGDMDYFNRQWMEFTGLSFEQIKDWGWTQFIHPDDVEENVRAWQQSIETGEPFHFEHRFRRADGKYRWHLSRAHAMRDAKWRHFHVDRIEHGHSRAEGKGRGLAAGQRRPAAICLFRQSRPAGADPQRRGVQRNRGAAVS